MLYALIMLVTINGHTDVFVIDRGLTYADCSRALASAKKQRQLINTVNITQSFTCKRIK